MNNLSLIGRAVYEPRIYTKDKKLYQLKIAKFMIATNEYSNGKQKAEFIPCVAFAESAAFVERNVHKGKLVSLIGKVTSSTFTGKSGKRRKYFEVNVQKIEFVESRKDEEIKLAELKDDPHSVINKIPKESAEDFEDLNEAVKANECDFE